MIKCGYVRVSREDQHPENQIALLEKEGVPRSRIYVDKLSGSFPAKERPGFIEMEQTLEGIEGDKILYVFELSRIGRSFLDTLITVNKLEEKGIKVWSLSQSEGWSRVEDQGIRNVILSVFAWAAQNEREDLIKRTKLGLARARSEGTKLGRPVRKLPTSRIKELRDKQISMAAISRILDIPYSTLRRNYLD